MTTESAVTKHTHADEYTDHLEHLAADEPWHEAMHRERQEAWAAEMREKLEVVSSRRRVYREVALRWHKLSPIRFRILCYFLEVADTDLDNIFPSRKTAAAVLGLQLPAYDWHVARLKKDGWMRTHEFRRPDGTQSSSGIQLGIPFPGDAGWGPARFSKRKQVTRRAVSRQATNGTQGKLLTARTKTY